mmetsp:Transcript_130790/g.406725  ORF Transcript_130790/g.406725 Transcript_130790/m.406725 type:complete len:150 (+) Transcript_130790:324-773(+)
MHGSGTLLQTVDWFRGRMLAPSLPCFDCPGVESQPGAVWDPASLCKNGTLAEEVKLCYTTSAIGAWRRCQASQGSRYGQPDLVVRTCCSRAAGALASLGLASDTGAVAPTCGRGAFAELKRCSRPEDVDCIAWDFALVLGAGDPGRQPC